MKNKDFNQRLVKNSFWSFVSSTINRVGALIFTIILARFLSPEGYGAYSLVLSTAMIFFTFSDLGINSTFVRYLSLSLEKNNKKIAGYHIYLLKLKLALSLFVSFLLLVLSYPLSKFVFHQPELFLPLIISSLYIFVLSFDNFYMQVFYSLEKMSYVSWREFLTNFLKIIFALTIFYLIAAKFFVFGIFLSFILISLVMLIYSLYSIRRILPEIYSKPKVKIDKNKVRKFAGYLTIASISTMLYSYFDTILLGIFVSAESIGLYRAAFSLIFGIVGILSFANIVLLPAFTKSNGKDTEKLFHSSFKYLSLITIPSIFGLLIFGKYIIVALFGYSYLAASFQLYFLSFLIFPAILLGIFLTLFSAKGKPELLAKIILITCLVNVTLNFILIPSLLKISSAWATNGAAISALVSWYIYFILAVIVIKKEFNIKVNFSHIFKPLLASVFMSASILGILYFVTNLNLLFGFVLVLSGIIIYFIALILLNGITKKDLFFIKFVLKKNNNLY